MQLRVLEKPHRFVLEIPEQSELVHEMRIEREAARQNQLEKSALTESEDRLARYPRPAEHDDLSIRRAI